MQAKRLRFPDDLYDALGHKVGARRQVEILIDYAKANQAVPLYCLYNATDESHPERYWHCNRPFELEQLGCTVAPAHAVRRSLSTRGQRTFQGVHTYPNVLPWRCLVHCPNILGAYGAALPGMPRQARLPFLDQDEVAVLHPALPRNIEAAFENGEIDHFDDELFRGNRDYFPRYLAVIDLSDVLQ
jgi:hypothetical protein